MRMFILSVALHCLGLAGSVAAQDTARPNVIARQVEYELFAPTFELTGRIEAARNFDAGFQTGGRLQDLSVDVGDTVTAGQVLARLNTTQQQAALIAAQAAERSATAQLDEAKRAFTRLQDLLASGATTRRSVEEAEAAQRVARGALDAAHANVARTQAAMKSSVVKVHAAGIVTHRFAQVGEVLQAGQPVFRIAEESQREAVFDVYEAALLEFDPDAAIELDVLANGRLRYTGQVREIAPLIAPATGTIAVRVLLQGASETVPLGVPVVARAQGRPRKAVVLPASAITVSANGPAVWVVSAPDNRLVLRDVDIETFTNDKVALRAGLSENEWVVEKGPRGMRQGQTVALIMKSPS